MRKKHSRRVPQEEAAPRQEQLSSRHLLQAGGQGCVASKFHPITGSTGRATCWRRGRKQVSSLLLLQAGGQSCVAFKFPPITGSTEEATCRHREKRRSFNHGLHRKDHSWSSRERAVLVAVLVVEGGKEHGGTDPSGLSCQRRLDLAAPGHGGRLRVVPSVVEPSNHHPQWRTRTALLRGTSCTLRPHGRCHASKKIEGYEPHPSSCA